MQTQIWFYVASIISFFTIFRKSYFFTALLVLVTLSASAQTTTISPYSRISIGDADGAVFNRNFAMGRLAYGLSGSTNLNPYNPATYSQLIWTNFEVGVMSKNYWLEAQDQRQSANKTHFNHLALGFPVTPWWGVSFGMMPVSQVGYDFTITSSLKSDSSNVPFDNNYFGSGGLNKVYLGNGFNLKKKYYFGFNFAYYFGDMQYEEVIDFDGFEDHLSTGSLQRIEAGDIYLDFGFQYKFSVNKKWKGNLGLVFTPIQGISAKESLFNFTYSRVSGRSRIIDTVSFKDNASFSIVLPPKYGIGLILNNSDRLILGLDLDYVAWSLSNYNTLNGLNDVLTIRTGAEFTDKDNRFKLRMGVRYGKMPIVIDGTKMDEMAISSGVVIPFRSKDKLTITEMNIGAEIGQRGKNTTGLLLERFINVHVGMTLNNKWFIKRKYD